MPVINTLEAVTVVNVGLNPFAIVEANEAVVALAACEADKAYDAEITLATNDAVVANDAETAFCACEADTA